MRFTRAEVRARLDREIEAGRPIVGAGAGTGISAKFIEAGGADLILVYNSGRFRMAGHSSMAGLMAYGDANAIVLEMGARDVLPVVKHTPVIAGVNGTDPTRRMSSFLDEVAREGFSGVNNFPSVGLFDGRVRRELESSGLGFDREVAMIKIARALELFTITYVFTEDEARQMAGIGADVVVGHMGLTVGGSRGMSAEDALSLDGAVDKTDRIYAAAKTENPDVIVLTHGGPIATPEDVAYVMSRSSAQGFVGASSMERLPVERALEAVTREFKSVGTGAEPVTQES